MGAEWSDSQIDRVGKLLDLHSRDDARRFDSIDGQLRIIREKQELADGRAYVYDRAIFGGSTDDGDRVIGICERIDDLVEDSQRAEKQRSEMIKGVDDLKNVVTGLANKWSQAPLHLMKFGLRALWVSAAAFVTAAGFIWTNWDKIERTVALWKGHL